jgi:hypothetical protein
VSSPRSFLLGERWSAEPLLPVGNSNQPASDFLIIHQQQGFVSLADLHWSDANLLTVNWSTVSMLSDEWKAKQQKSQNGEKKDRQTQLREYLAAVRANRQVAVGLQNQGLNEEAAHFAYRAQINQRHVLLLQVMQRIEQLPGLNWLVFELPIPRRYLEILKFNMALATIAPFLIIFLHISTTVLATQFPLFISILFYTMIILSLLTIPLLAIGLLIYKPISRLILMALLLALLYGALLLSGFFLVILLLEYPDLILFLVYMSLFFAFLVLLGISRSQQLVKIKEQLQHKYALILPYFTVQLTFGRFEFSMLLDILAGYGYKPGRTLFWYVFVIFGFATAYYAYGNIHIFPDAFVFSLTSFHGRGFFPGLGNETSLHNPLVILAALEAVIGLLIEISFIATFTQRYFGR